MGSEDLFHKRRAKTQRQLQRKPKNKKRAQRVLIVCEGEKTEPQYLSEAVQHYRLRSVEVDFSRPKGTAPSNLWEFAKKQAIEERKQANEYDLIFCVFDRDSHPCFDKTVKAINDADNKFMAITSVPCFEYWLLLHFIYTRKPFNKAGAKSPADVVIQELRKYLPSYEKASQGLFSELLDQLSSATTKAQNALNDASATGAINPTTSIHLLFQELKKLEDKEDSAP
ncbi:MAG: RloB family protein [Gammaproteobacteria bacterium]|nr:RloB family protein [Gammaproteobacteria bacterium]